jgi:hypothetical protein
MTSIGKKTGAFHRLRSTVLVVNLRRAVVTATACVMLLGAAASATNAANAKPVCPRGYLGTTTLDETLVRLAGFLTEEEIRAGFAAHDENENGIVCHKRPPPFEEKFFPFELIVDDLARGSA